MNSTEAIEILRGKAAEAERDAQAYDLAGMTEEAATSRVRAGNLLDRAMLLACQAAPDTARLQARREATGALSCHAITMAQAHLLQRHLKVRTLAGLVADMVTEYAELRGVDLAGADAELEKVEAKRERISNTKRLGRLARQGGMALGAIDAGPDVRHE